MLVLVGLVGLFSLTIGLVALLGASQRHGLVGKLRALIVGGLALGLGLLCVGLAMAMRSFEAFAQSTVIAEAECKWIGPKEFELSYTPISAGQRKATQVFHLRGDQWSISGGVVKWHPWLTALGLPSYHRPTRISGRFANVTDETAAPPTAVALGQELDRCWWVFYHLDPVLPFVEAVYGSAAYTYVNPAVRVEISVTPAGYFIDRVRKSRSREVN